METERFLRMAKNVPKVNFKFNYNVLGRYHGKGWLLTALYSAPLLIFIGIQNQSRVYGKNPSTWEYKADPEYLTHGVSMYQREKDNKLDLF